MSFSTCTAGQKMYIVTVLATVYFTCDPPCENGVCVSGNTCNCTTGFDGVTCSDRVTCDPPCENGVCVARDTCNCAAGFEGITCTQKAVENNIPTIIGAAAGGSVLLLVGIVAVICIITRRLKRVQQSAAPKWNTPMEMKECKAYGTLTTDEHSSSVQQQEESEMPAPENEDTLYTYMSAPKCDITCGDGEVYENTPVVTSGDAEEVHVYETMLTSEHQEDEYIYEPVTWSAEEHDEELSYL